MKTFETHCHGAQNAVDLISKNLPLISTRINSTWFPVENQINFLMNHSIEPSPFSWLVQFSGREDNHQTDLIPCVITVLINGCSSLPGTFEFIPVHVLRQADLGFIETKVYDTENILDHDVHDVIPAFDCVIDKYSDPISAKVIIKLFIQYKNDKGKIACRAEMPFDISYIIQGTNNLNWWPQNHKSLIY